MEPPCRPKALQKLRERLCTETEPRQLYKTLKKLSSQPMLGDILEEIGFRQTIKLLRKQQLLVPFAKALASQWSEGCPIEPQPEPGPQDFAFQKSPRTESRRDSAEDQPPEPASPEQRGDGREVFEESSSSSEQSLSRSARSPRSPHTSLGDRRAACSPRAEPAGRRWQRGRRGPFGDRQLGSESQVRAAKPQGIVGEPRRLPGLPPVCSKAEAVPAKPKPKPQSLSPLRAETPGPWIQEDYPAGSFEDCLNYDSSLSSSPTQPPSKRKRTGPCEAHTQCPAAAMVPQSKAQSCKDLNLLLAASPFPEVTSTLQDCFPQEGPEHPSFTDEQEVAPWAWRSSSKTPVYSPRRPGRPLQQNSYQGRLAKPQSWWETHGQPAPPREDAQLWSQQEGDSGTQTHTDKQTHRRTQTETQAHLRQQESLDLKLQSLRARILNSQAKRPQGRQTKMISFQAQAPSPGQHADSGPGGEASPENVHSLREASGPGLLRGAPRPPLGGSHKTLAKKPAPLMAKALKDYKNRWARK